MLIRLLPAKTAGACVHSYAVDVRGEGLFVIRVVESDVMDAMSQLVESLSEQPHGAEKGHDLLDVVPSVIRFVRISIITNNRVGTGPPAIQLWCSFN